MLGELFDPKGELLIQERLRPHWSQAALSFRDFRTRDSIPREVLRRWEHEKNDWMHAGYLKGSIGRISFRRCLTKNVVSLTSSSIIAGKSISTPVRVDVCCGGRSWRPWLPMRYCTLMATDTAWETM